MFHECPNCRAAVPFLRSIWLTAWGSFRCKACGSVLGVSRLRRQLAGGIWIAAVLIASGFCRWRGYGPLVTLAAPLVLVVAIYYLCEKVVVVDRLAFTCKKCGYDLQGLPENRCPECGTPFDPAERERILARIAAPPPKPRPVWVALSLLILLALVTATGLVVWRCAPATRASRTAAPTAPTSVPTSQSGG